MTHKAHPLAPIVRRLGSWVVVLAVVTAPLVASTGCGRSTAREHETAISSTGSTSPGGSSEQRFPARTIPDPQAHLRYLTFNLGGTSENDRLPLLVAIHGLGDTPENFSRWLVGLQLRLRLIVPQAPTAHGQGYSWFPYRPGRTEHELALGIAKSRDRLEQLLDELQRRFPTRGKPAVLGFSQGGMLSFALAAHAPERLSLVIPLGGLLPSELEPALIAVPRARPLVFAFHGTADPVVPFDGAKHATERLSSLGYEARLTSYAGVGHQISSGMRDEVFDKLTAWTTH